jgi:hypothetical protein
MTRYQAYMSHAQGRECTRQGRMATMVARDKALPPHQGVGRYRDVRLSLLQASIAVFLVRSLSRMSLVLLSVSQYPNAADWALYGPTTK